MLTIVKYHAGAKLFPVWWTSHVEIYGVVPPNMDTETLKVTDNVRYLISV